MHSDPWVGYAEPTVTFVFKEIAFSEAQNMLIRWGAKLLSDYLHILKKLWLGLSMVFVDKKCEQWWPWQMLCLPIEVKPEHCTVIYRTLISLCHALCEDHWILKKKGKLYFSAIVLYNSKDSRKYFLGRSCENQNEKWIRLQWIGFGVQTNLIFCCSLCMLHTSSHIVKSCTSYSFCDTV
jgi:hypothetical protein